MDDKNQQINKLDNKLKNQDKTFTERHHNQKRRENKSNEERMKMFDIECKAKDTAKKTVKLQEENEDLRMTGFRIYCNVCDVDFTTMEKAEPHAHQPCTPRGSHAPMYPMVTVSDASLISGLG